MTYRKAALFSWISLFFMFVSCLPKQEVLQNPTARTRRGPTVTPQSPAIVSQTGLEYIARYRQIAVDEMHLHGIPASIKLAQAILESGNGNSRLAREANNHFGIKCATDWKGPRIYHDDDEKDDCFRSYATPEASFRDHSLFLLRPRYEKLFTLDPRDYRGWAHGLKEAGYATNPRYAELLIGLIERYELYRYDAVGAFPAEAKTGAIAGTGTVAGGTSSAETVNASTHRKRVAMRVHEVVPGDTATGIAAKYGLSVPELLEINGLKHSDLHPGQLLVVSR